MKKEEIFLYTSQTPFFFFHKDFLNDKHAFLQNEYCRKMLSFLHTHRNYPIIVFYLALVVQYTDF